MQRLLTQPLKRILNAAGLYVYRRPAADVFYQALIDRTQNFASCRWMGQPIWQTPLDLWTIQETLVEMKPELVIECGTNQGSSARYYAHLFDQFDHGRIITIDVLKQHTL